MAAGAVALIVPGYRVLTYGTPPATVTEVAAPATATDLVASGMIGTQSWQIRLRPSPDVRGPDQVCWFGQGPAFGFPRNEDTPGECGKFQARRKRTVTARSPASARTRCGSSTSGCPHLIGIASATAYLNNGQHATTIPINSMVGLSAFPPWKWHSAPKR